MEIKRINSSERHLVTTLFDEYRVFYKQPSDKSLAERFIQERLQNNESVIFVALDHIGGEAIPIGFTQLYPKYSSMRAVRNWILNDLYVDINHRRKGIGEKLIHTAMEFALANKAKFVQLETAIDNFTAQSLYESIGFKRQQPDSDFYVYRIELA